MYSSTFNCSAPVSGILRVSGSTIALRQKGDYQPLFIPPGIKVNVDTIGIRECSHLYVVENRSHIDLLFFKFTIRSTFLIQSDMIPHDGMGRIPNWTSRSSELDLVPASAENLHSRKRYAFWYVSCATGNLMCPWSTGRRGRCGDSA